MSYSRPKVIRIPVTDKSRAPLAVLKEDLQHRGWKCTEISLLEGGQFGFWAERPADLRAKNTVMKNIYG